MPDTTPLVPIVSDEEIAEVAESRYKPSDLDMMVPDRAYQLGYGCGSFQAGAIWMRAKWEQERTDLTRKLEEATAFAHVVDQLAGLAPWINDVEMKKLLLKEVAKARAFLSTLNS